jgi:hypothetical protein
MRSQAAAQESGMMPGVFDATPLEFAEVLTWLSEREGRRTVLLITGPVDEDSPTLVRADAPLGPMETVDEGALSCEVVGTASFPVGDALVSMYGPEFVRAELFADANWVIVHQRHAKFEWRLGGDAD